MKMKYKYIEFKLLEQKAKTTVWSCNNLKSNITLGIIKWFPSWRQYCFSPINNSVYSKGCLEDVNHFIQQLDNKRKK